MAHGTGLARGATVEGASIPDMTPTILHAMGEPVPDDMDGSVLRGLFDGGWWKANPPRYRVAPSFEGPEVDAVPSTDEGLKDRLRALGYLD